MKTAAHVLIVDDEPLNCQLLELLLNESGYKTTLCFSAEQAWVRMKSGVTFDLVLLDRMMPGMDGLELLRDMKADPVLRLVPVIMQTVASSLFQIAEGIAAGVFYYMTKPYSIDLLMSIVHTAIDDARRYSLLQQQVDTQMRLPVFLHKAEFRFRRLDDVDALARLLAGLCPEPKRVVVGLYELLANAVEHGLCGLSYEEKTRLLESRQWYDELRQREQNAGEESFIRVTVEIDTAFVRYTITDPGKGFEWSRYLQFPPECAFDSHGRGIAMAKTLSFDDLQFEGQGNIVVATVNRSGRAEDNAANLPMSELGALSAS